VLPAEIVTQAGAGALVNTTRQIAGAAVVSRR
jgi:hypothetical protein